MNDASVAYQGYNNSLQSTGNEKDIEYKVFARITRELALKKEDNPNYHQKMTEALHDNLRLWAILAGDIANDNNELPAELRSGLFYLAEFTRNHTSKVYAGEADADILIEINTMVMRGLRAQPTSGSGV